MGALAFGFSHSYSLHDRLLLLEVENPLCGLLFDHVLWAAGTNEGIEQIAFDFRALEHPQAIAPPARHHKGVDMTDLPPTLNAPGADLSA